MHFKFSYLFVFLRYYFFKILLYFFIVCNYAFLVFHFVFQFSNDIIFAAYRLFKQLFLLFGFA